MARTGSGGPDGLPGSPASSPSVPGFEQIMDRFCGFDLNKDGVAEINSLKSLFETPEPYTPMPNGVVIVFVDPRLVSNDPSNPVTSFEMKTMLGLVGSDMFNDGYYPYFVLADVYSGARHQDGRTLLAMRRFLKEIARYYPLKATQLVGSFPDASIVRTVMVKDRSSQAQPVSFQSGSSLISGYVGDYLRIDSEFVTPRADIVLGDLDGNWEALYREHLATPDLRMIPTIPTQTYPANNQTLSSQTYQSVARTFDDVFHIVDHNVVATQAGGTLTMELNNLAEPSPEASESDQQLPNRIARPEIVVTRLSALSVAVQPYPATVGSSNTGTPVADLDGKLPLDAAGVPQRLRYEHPTEIRWQRDPGLERRLISSYLARNHRFRVSPSHPEAMRIASLRGPDTGLRSPDSFNDLLGQAFNPLIPLIRIASDNASAADYVEWLKLPAILRGIATHCDGVNCQFTSMASPRDLEIATGAPAYGQGVWRWISENQGGSYYLTPSFANLKVDANFYVYRSLWENKILANAAQTFVVHDGCEVMRPKNAETVPYNHITYGQHDNLGHVANGESLVFYTNVIGLMARNKVFNDTPEGFSQAIRSTDRFAYGWSGYFSADANNTLLDERAADATITEPDNNRRWRTLQRKRSYFWSVIGDPTLHLHRR